MVLWLKEWAQMALLKVVVVSDGAGGDETDVMLCVVCRSEE